MCHMICICFVILQINWWLLTSHTVCLHMVNVTASLTIVQLFDEIIVPHIQNILHQNKWKKESEGNWLTLVYLEKKTVKWG